MVTPRLTRSFKVLNRFFNTLAYDPPGSAEPFLFWSAWAAHAGATLYDLQDAHGPIRRGSSCLLRRLQTLEQIVAGNPQLGMLTRLLTSRPRARSARQRSICTPDDARPP